MKAKGLSFLLISLVLISVFSCADSKKQGKIKLGNEEWAVSRSLNYLGKVILEKNGFEAEIVDTDIESIYGGLNSGKIDLFLDTWVEGHGVYLYEFKDVEDLGAIYKGCKLGIAVPSYFDVDSISDLLRDSSSYGNMFYGEEKDAGVMISSMTAMKQYGLNPEIVHMSEDQLINQMRLMIDNKQNFVTGAWKPHWKIEEFDLKFLVDTTHSFIENDEIHKYARAGFKKDYPEAARVLSKITFTEEEMATYLLHLKGATEAADLEARINQWLSENPEKSKNWIN